MPRLGCLPELVDESMGLLYDPADRRALQKALVEVRTRDLKEAGVNALARAQELDWDRIASSLSAIYQG